MYISGMKELDRTKAYDLRDLNDEQRKELLNYMRSNFEKIYLTF